MTIPEDVLNDFRHRTVVSVDNPRWLNAEQTVLMADVVFEELSELGPLPFSTYATTDTTHGLEVWNKANAGDYGPIAPYVQEPEAIPISVSSRQFKLQLYAANLMEQVESWVAAQSVPVQIAYANSGSFVRNEPMMQQGFTELGFTTEQIDQFFLAASKL